MGGHPRRIPSVPRRAKPRGSNDWKAPQKALKNMIVSGGAGQDWERESEKARPYEHGGPGLKGVQWMTEPSPTAKVRYLLCVHVLYDLDIGVTACFPV